MNELIGMLFQIFCSVEFRFTCPAESAAVSNPIMGEVLEADISLRLVKGHNGIAPVGELAAVEAAPGEHGGHLRDGDAV